MKIAVTDACIFIDIYDLQLTSKFFSIDLEIHTTVDVFNELFNNQKELLSAYKLVGKLIIHSLNEEDRNQISKTVYSKALSDNDKSVLHIATKIGAIVLSSDRSVRLHAKKSTIEYHGMLWVFDKLIELNLISVNEACEKLTRLINTNLVYQNNAELVDEMNKRLALWKK